MKKPINSQSGSKLTAASWLLSDENFPEGDVLDVSADAIGVEPWELGEIDIAQEVSTSKKRQEPTILPTFTTLDGFTVGDRVTMKDLYHVRSADVGTVESISSIGIQVLWDNNSPHEKLTQPPTVSRTFDAVELKLVHQPDQQNERED